MAEIAKKILHGAEEAAYRIAHETNPGEKTHPVGIFRVTDRNLSEAGVYNPYWINGLLAYQDINERAFFIGFKALNGDIASSDNPGQARSWKVFNPYKPSSIIDSLNITPEELLVVTEGILQRLPYNLEVLSAHKRAVLLMRYRDSLIEAGDSIAETHLREQLRTNVFEALLFREAIEKAISYALEKNHEKNIALKEKSED